jgi:hypothetical protein
MRPNEDDYVSEFPTLQHTRGNGVSVAIIATYLITYQIKARKLDAILAGVADYERQSFAKFMMKYGRSL